MTIRVAITAFGRGEGRNASCDLLEYLQADLTLGRRAGVRLDLRLLADLEASVLDILESEAPDFLLMFGQAPGRNRINFERIAVNIKDYILPGVPEKMFKGVPVVADGPAAYLSTLPIDDSLVDDLQAQGIPAAFSNHAGAFLCNEVLYLALHIASTRGLKTRVSFIHIPANPEQVIGNDPGIARHFNCAAMETVTVARAVETVLRRLAMASNN